MPRFTLCGASLRLGTRRSLDSALYSEGMIMPASTSSGAPARARATV
jgi:hypothetical protein